MNNKEYAIRILNEIGIPADESCIENLYGGDSAYTKTFVKDEVSISAQVVFFGNSDTCRVDIDFSLPQDGVLADTFMNHCAKKENLPKNNYGYFCTGPTYSRWEDECHKKNTFALSPWHNTSFYVRSEHYKKTEVEEAVTNAIALAKRFASHLSDLSSLKFWNTTDKEVIAKAKEIISKANLKESDLDREERAHHIVDENSFFKGWFYPFNDHGRGTFDILWPSSIDYAASSMGIKGSFEYAVSCVLLENPDFIAKARKACRIRTETVMVKF